MKSAKSSMKMASGKGHMGKAAGASKVGKKTTGFSKLGGAAKGKMSMNGPACK